MRGLIVSVVFVFVFARAAAVPAQGSSEPVRLPPPTGAHAVGVLDFTFIDLEYPSRRASDRDGRRLMARVWYPAAGATGQPRKYLDEREFDVTIRPLLEALAPVVPDPTLFDRLAAAATHGHEGAPVAAGGPFPALVFSHGGLSYISQNTVLMEDLASHGYVVFSVAHPGGSSGVLFPDGMAVTYDQDWRDAVLGAVGAPDPEGRNSPDVGKRYEAATRFVDDGGLGPWSERWRDDMIALVDFVGSDRPDAALASILRHTALADLGYFGMSYGAAAAVSAAQIDERARVAINFDGTHWLSDVLAKDVRTPLLVLMSEDPARYSNEFFFEPLETMGTRDDIVRIKLQPEATHMELTDVMFLPAATRRALPGDAGRVDGARLSDTINAFVRAFFDHYLKGAADGFPETVLAKFPEVARFDLPHVRAWAESREP